MRRLFLVAMVALLAGAGGAVVGPGRPGAASAAGCVAFAETNHQVCGRFLAYWQEHGGLAINGLPLTPVRSERLEDGKTYQVQYFERARFEYHPENAGTPYTILLGQFGRTILNGATPTP